ncbi:hypothetical protein DH2020_021123 [Rehmannia glutinosa]|uniref:Uncharacterized protein n=1 Tax=Rehmannia glutinosa TaxID=99300 RepID=A0ABR0WBS3_REHGL
MDSPLPLSPKSPSSSPSSDADNKPDELSLPEGKVAFICNGVEDKEEYYYIVIIDLNSRTDDDDVDDEFIWVTPVVRLQHVNDEIHAFCILGSTLYMIESNECHRLESDHRIGPPPKSVYTIDLSSYLSDHDPYILKKSELGKAPDMLHPKTWPLAIATPDGNKILVLSSTITGYDTSAEFSGEHDFELYDPDTRSWTQLPGIRYDWDKLFRRYPHTRHFDIATFTFIGKSTFFIETSTYAESFSMYTIDLESLDKGWEKRETFYGYISTQCNPFPFLVIGEELCLTSFGAFDITKRDREYPDWYMFPLPSYGVEFERCGPTSVVLLDDVENGQCSFCITQSGLGQQTGYPHLTVVAYHCDVAKYKEDKEKNGELAELRKFITELPIPGLGSRLGFVIGFISSSNQISSGGGGKVAFICNCDTTIQGECYDIFILDLNSKSHDDELIRVRPTIRVKQVDENNLFYIFGSTLYMIDSHVGWINYSPNPAKSVYTFDLSSYLHDDDVVTEPNLKILEKSDMVKIPDMLHPKLRPYATPIPSGELLVFSSSFDRDDYAEMSGERDFELFDPNTGSWKLLPGIPYDWDNHRINKYTSNHFFISSFTFTSESTIFIETSTPSTAGDITTSMFSIDLESPDNGWKKWETFYGATDTGCHDYPFLVIEEELCLTTFGACDITKRDRGRRDWYVFPYPSYDLHIVDSSSIKATVHLDDVKNGQCNFCLLESALDRQANSLYITVFAYHCDLAKYREDKRKKGDYVELSTVITEVELYADYDPKMLLPFFQSSQHYTLEKAQEICVKRDLLREQVFILGRMGNAKQALAVIINKLGDIEEAIEFASMQHDDELWEELIKQCLNKPEMVGVLLEHTVGNLDPLYIVNMVPNGLEIPRFERHNWFPG